MAGKSARQRRCRKSERARMGLALVSAEMDAVLVSELDALTGKMEGVGK